LQTICWQGLGDNSELIARLCASVWSGNKVIVHSDSKGFIKKIEETLNGQSQEIQIDGSDDEDHQPPTVWSIHSENSGSEENVAFIKAIPTAVKSVDALLTSPSLGTGVDIPDYHFDEIYGIFYGATQTATECAQQLWRYRPNVPVHVWVTPRPPFGYESCNASKIKQYLLESNRMTAFLIRRDRETGQRGAEKDWALDAFCTLKAQRQFSINNLRSDLRSLLEEMGNRIIPVESQVNEVYKAKLKQGGTLIDLKHCPAVAGKELIDKQTYQERQSKDYLSLEEFQECEKFRIWESYGKAVTPELVKQDDGGKLLRRLIALEEVLEATEGMIISEDVSALNLFHRRS
jgi:hypothetical protein